MLFSLFLFWCEYIYVTEHFAETAVATFGIMLLEIIDNAKGEQVTDSGNVLFTSCCDSGVTDENLFE